MARTGRFPLRLFVVVTVVSTAVGALLGEPVVVQPYPYNHAVHTRLADCSLCHRGVRTQQHAGLPSLTICTRCHATAPGPKPTANHRALWQRALVGKAPRWNRLYRLPSHVYFSHRRHVALGKLPCERCHGDMKHRTSPPPRALVKLYMRDCLRCHRQQQVTQDCTACHR